MTDVSIDQLVEQFEGRKFGELVLNHIEKQSFEQLVVGIQATMEELPTDVQREIEGLIDSANPLARRKNFWADDCGKILRFISNMIENELHDKEIPISEDDLFNAFNIIVMSYAYSAHKDPRMTKFIKKSIGKGLFSW